MKRDSTSLPLLNSHKIRSAAAFGKKGVMLMNRIGPSASTLYLANSDGTNERPLLNATGFDYHASFSPDGQWITFTSERNGDDNSDLYRCRPDGSGLQKVLATSSFEDALVISPNGSQVSSKIKKTGTKFLTTAGCLCINGKWLQNQHLGHGPRYRSSP